MDPSLIYQESLPPITIQMPLTLAEIWHETNLLLLLNSVIHYMNLKEELKIIEMFIADIWHGSNQLLCNLYTVHVIFYLFDNHVILLGFLVRAIIDKD